MHLFVSIWHIPFFIASAVGIQNVDVAIIGGGLSGLATAKEIAKAGKSFAILEARDRLRLEELGAEFVGPTQDRVLALAAELSLTAYPTYTAGKSISVSKCVNMGRMTLKSFLEARITLQDWLFLFETAIRSSILSTETKEPSLLTQLLATALAEKLGAQNIYLDSPVGKVKLNGGRYTVMSNRLQVSAKHVVVAMSPPLAGRIFYDPLLPAGRDQLTQRMPMGSIGKAIAIYPKPYDTGDIRAAFDNTPANATFGAILGFIEADEMRALDKVSQTEVKVLLQQWDMEEFSRVLTQYGCYLRNPAGNIHFAGTKTSPYWTGYMDGAIRSGERAAAEVNPSTH
ncbi:hypothetical protein BDV23DRAFT_168260 [Aspergillus alliaceus]|uniref:monoamine oxidase n=1 Tax=Petromyces alliaceus TaxID=209559 RepID=A0A5N7CNT4_PETAA|nr:hypothetical protein BDV23DRAFT_168260 [Aspergillus alliaceus]